MLQQADTSQDVLSNQIRLQRSGCDNSTYEGVNTGPCPCMAAKQQRNATCDFPEIRALIPVHVSCGSSETCKFREIKALEKLFAQYRVLDNGLIDGKYATSQVELSERKTKILALMQPVIENYFE